MRKWLASLALVALITGCARAPAPAPAAPGPTAPPPPANPDPVVQDECRPEQREGIERIDFVVDGKVIGSLPARDCTIAAVPGANLILHIYPSQGIGAPVVTDVGESIWEHEHGYVWIPAFGVKPGGSRELKLNLSELGMGEFTYSFVAREPTTYTLASAAERQGPWVDVTQFIDPHHRWLRIAYSGPMDRSAAPVAELPLKWEGDRTAYLSLTDAPVVFTVEGGRDAGGFPARGPAPPHAYYYRSEMPKLARVTPEGSVSVITALQGIPERWHAVEGKLLYQLVNGPGFTVDLKTGAHAEGPRIEGAHGFGETSRVAPAGNLVANLELPGGPDVQEDRIDPALLVIFENNKEIARVQDFVRVHRIVPGCTVGGASLAWRPDGGAVAAISAAAPGRLELVIYDLAKKQRRVLASKPGGPSGVYGGLTWAPGWRYLTFGEHLFDTRTGQFITDGLSRDVRWNPAGTHLLEKQPGPFVRWQELAIIEAATGTRTTLGYGDMVGWTDSGDALVIMWDESRHIPPPGKGCLP